MKNQRQQIDEAKLAIENRLKLLELGQFSEVDFEEVASAIESDAIGVMTAIELPDSFSDVFIRRLRTATVPGDLRTRLIKTVLRFLAEVDQCEAAARNGDTP